MSPLLLFPDFALIALGYLLRRYWLGAPHWVTVEKLVYYVLFPCLLFFSVASSPLGLESVGYFALGSPAIIFATFLLGWAVRPLTKMSRIDLAAGAQTAYRFNTYIGLALASRLAGQEGVANLAILVALGVPLCNVLAVGTMSRGKKSVILFEIAKNPLIIGTSLGIIAKLAGIQVPEPVMLSLERLAQAAVSLGLLAVGAGLVFSGLRGHILPSIWWLSIKLFISPLLAIGYAYVFELSTLQAQVLLVFCSIPSASSAYILASRMGGNAALVACLISLSTVFAAISIPFVFGISGY